MLSSCAKQKFLEQPCKHPALSSDVTCSGEGEDSQSEGDQQQLTYSLILVRQILLNVYLQGAFLQSGAQGFLPATKELDGPLMVCELTTCHVSVSCWQRVPGFRNEISGLRLHVRTLLPWLLVLHARHLLSPSARFCCVKLKEHVMAMSGT